MIKRVIKNWRQGRKRPGLLDVVLHIGAPKCGSSAIQRLCVSHRDHLLTMGYYYPEHTLDVNGVSGGHTQLAGALINGKKEQASTTFQRWLAEARAHQACLLLSAEALYGQHEAMAEFCRGLNIRVVGFLRHPVDYLLANHNQGIKRHMDTRRLGQLLPELLGRPTGHLVGLPLLKWADAFGDDNCCFMAYQSPSAGGSPVEKLFLEALGIPTSKLEVLLNDLKGITNRSYVKSALELKRLLNTVLDELPANSAHQVDWSLQGYSDRAVDEQGYTMSDLSIEVREHLERDLLKQMETVIRRFPALASAADVTAESEKTLGCGWLDLSAPLAALQADTPQVVEQIKQSAVTLRDQGRQDYAFCKLLDVLGIEFNEPRAQTKLPGLSVQQRKVLEKDTSREADCLRELAVLLERQELLEDALFAIKCALDRRPQGTGIQRIKARIEEKLSLTLAKDSPKPRSIQKSEVK
ncbi:hypothetical protein [Vreelandella titanicae]|uniref:Uncharacterized protein n=1 Tax=Vreelandella titanicae TaxID=664683 RepID=A0A558J1Z0_9GAMM|nr:hypothetical protein [Halomonas titanicae]TVU87582.1 hypothetical protein FQP89_20765 [Halomonas titanicae]